MPYKFYLLPDEFLKAKRDRKALKQLAKKITKVPKTVRRYT